MIRTILLSAAASSFVSGVVLDDTARLVERGVLATDGRGHVLRMSEYSGANKHGPETMVKVDGSSKAVENRLITGDKAVYHKVVQEKLARMHQAEMQQLALQNEIIIQAQDLRNESQHLIEAAQNHKLNLNKDKGFAIFEAAAGTLFSKVDLELLAGDLRDFAQNASNIAMLKELRAAQESNTAQFVVYAKGRVDEFASRTSNMTNEKQILSELATAIGNWRMYLNGHQAEALRIRTKIQDAMPLRLAGKANEFMGLITPSLKFNWNHTEVAHMTVEEACGKITDALAKMGPEHAKLKTANTVLYTASALVPVMRDSSAGLDQHATDVLHDLIGMGYVEATAMERASEDLVRDVGPVVMRKLSCGISAASSLRGGVTVVLLSLALTLQRWL